MKNIIKNKKGFVISITTLLYVALFLSFLLIIINLTQKPIFIPDQHSLETQTMYKYIEGDNNQTGSGEYWCVLHVSAYDANENLNTQSQINLKTYCEDYNGKRII
ncbi:MAG TPA: hypothetical protein P5513_05860 [Candidatus Diapherotrites archaeon]|nr:hypothetical protein [Candidatus Diapherotrites archaeon]